MSRFSRELSDAGWYRGLKIPASVIRNIDEKTKKAISETGGTWSPSAPIILGGEGLELQCALQLTNATANPGAGYYFIFGDDDYFQNEALVSRTIDDSPQLMSGSFSGGREFVAYCNDSTGAASMMARHPGARGRFPLRIPDGSYLAAVAISFRVGTAHANVPATLPKARVVRIAADGTITPHPDCTNDVERDGWLSPALPASGVLWYAAGAIQTLTLNFDYTITDQADTSTYAYALEWIEEDGTNAFNPTNDEGNHVVHLCTTVYQPDLRPY